MVKTTLVILLILTGLVTYSYQSLIDNQTYYDKATLVNDQGVQCDVDYCDNFTDDDDVVFVGYDVIKNINNGAVCRVSCGDVLQDSVVWNLWSVKF